MYDYDIVIIGGGSGGLVAASSTAQLGLDVLLVEKERLGGDCLWYGCVPSKSLIASARHLHEAGRLAEWGLPDADVGKPDFKKVMKYMRSVQKAIEPHDSPKRFRKLGCTVEFGIPAFVNKHEILLNKKRVTFKYAIIATGSTPRVPDIPGLDGIEYLTNLNVFNLKTLPEHLVIIGGGPIGTEIGQVFARLGSKVSILARSGLLSKEDPDLAKMLEGRLQEEGIDVCRCGIRAVEQKHSKTRIRVEQDGKAKTISCDQLVLIATGRLPNLEGLQLERASVAYDEGGIEVDSYLRTTAKNIYAIGDVVGGHQFTHMAASHASIAVRNIITPLFKSSAETDVVPWVTYTDPELARVGKIEREIEGTDYEVLEMDFSDIDRAICEHETFGKMKVLITGKGRILGASILGLHAGELIMEYALAMKHGLRIQDIAGTIHPYPTLSGGSWTLAGKYYKKFVSEKTRRLTQFLVRKL